MRINRCKRRVSLVVTFCVLLSLLLPQAALAQAQPADGGSNVTADQRPNSSRNHRDEQGRESQSGDKASGERRASGRVQEARSASGQSIGSVLNPDGTLNAQAAKGASFNARGFKMQLGKNGEPQFRPAATTANCSDNWDDRFNLPGADNNVLAVADDGNGNIYVGGSFKTIGNTQASGIAQVETELRFRTGDSVLARRQRLPATGPPADKGRTESDVCALGVDLSGCV
jgi:hypothetical protein